MTSIKQLFKSLGLSIGLLLATIMLFESSHLDISLQDYFYNFNTQSWLVNRDAFWPNLIFYDGAKSLIIIFVLSILVGLIAFRKHPLIQTYQRRLWLIVLAGISIPLLIGALKATTNIPCPRDIDRYGGAYPHVSLWHRYPDTYHPAEKQRCYPAGHASGGFALLALVFLFNTRRARLIIFSVVLVLASSMGIYKMLIGDHFLSHTIITALISWIGVRLLSYLLKI
ncbi:phosphatase PAP2 family protein [Thiolinea disciformis]|uniref:phosphatase PAP2 family protein n=1 Tax=Thiolinea disciformis TaxID=125614 RepID=UPI00037B6ADD|nr:phosphatase PAP2 family protein [Thiolinea disciformis]